MILCGQVLYIVIWQRLKNGSCLQEQGHITCKIPNNTLMEQSAYHQVQHARISGCPNKETCDLKKKKEKKKGEGACPLTKNFDVWECILKYHMIKTA